MKGGRTGDLRKVRSNLMCVASYASSSRGGVLACASPEGHIWVCGPAAGEICYHQRSEGVLDLGCCLEPCAELVHRSPAAALRGRGNPKGLSMGELVLSHSGLAVVWDVGRDAPPQLLATCQPHS